MKGLDTNVVVRYLTQDDPVQAQKATQVIEEGVDQDRGILPHVRCPV